MNDLCDGLDFRVHDTRGRLAESEKDHVWKAGDGFLFHLNTYHRGPGHTDPKGTERVMLIMTISNRPKGPHFDRRQISLGTSYSNKWDMWGMTMKDLLDVDKTFGFPWKYLRTFGIWKPKGNRRSHDLKWGWDYITVACSRIMNDQMGFRYEDLEVFVKKMSKYGPIFQYMFGYLPEEGGYDDITMTIDNGWRDFLPEILKRIIFVASVIYGISTFFFTISSLVASGSTSTFKRLVVINAIIASIFYGWFTYVSNTPWGRDIISNRSAESPFLDKIKITEQTVVPTKQDVLFSERLNSPFLAGMNIIYEQQQGNAKFNDLLSKNANLFSKEFSVPSDYRLKIVKNISKTLLDSGGRFLKNDFNGDWYIPSEKEISTLVERSLVSESNHISKMLYQQIQFLRSECLFSRFKKTAMMKIHALANLENLVKSIYDLESNKNIARPSSPLNHTRLFVPKLDIRAQDKQNADEEPIKNYTPAPGDHIEYYFEGDGWFQGRVQSVNRRRGFAAIQFYDGEYQSKAFFTKMRPFKDFRYGELVMADGDTCHFNGVSAFGEAKCLIPGGNEFVLDVHDISRLDTGTI